VLLMTPLQSWATIALLFVLVGLLVFIVTELEARVAGRQQRNRSAEIPAKLAHDPAIASVHDMAAARARRTMLARPEDDDCPKSRSGELYDQTVDDL
jgi:hypothetical protein